MPDRRFLTVMFGIRFSRRRLGLVIVFDRFVIRTGILLEFFKGNFTTGCGSVINTDCVLYKSLSLLIG